MHKQTTLVENLLASLSEIEDIPREYRGVLFERVLKGFAPFENRRKLELAFALVWADRNAASGDRLLASLLYPNGTQEDERAPATAREWEVAHLTAATIMQWLGTPSGFGYLREAIEKNGGHFDCRPPLCDEAAPPAKS